MPHVKNKIKLFIGSPYGAFFVTILPIASTITLAISKDSIIKAFPLYVGSEWDGVSKPAILFWSLLSLFALLFYNRQSWQDKETNAKQKELIDATTELKKLILTMPPARFLGTTMQRIEGCLAILTEVSKEQAISLENLTKCINVILKHILLAAIDFDDVDPNTRYAANIMLFKPCTNEDFERNMKSLKFSFMDRSRLLGVLEMKTRWSVATRRDDAQSETPDSRLAEFSLPVPSKEHKETEDHRWRTLPGAPLSYISEKPNYYRDTKSLMQWMEKQKEFPQSVIDELNQYFQSEIGQLIQSFASFPIIKGNECIGVLNIHRNSPGILRTYEDGGERDFATLMQPFCAILYLILCKNYN